MRINCCVLKNYGKFAVKYDAMKKFFLMVFLLPLLVYAQGDYPSDAKKIFKEAQTEYRKGNSAGALVLYKKCIDAEPTFSEAYLNVAIIEYSNQAYENSLEYSRKALVYNKVQAPIYTQIGKSYFMIGSYDSSSYYLNMAIVFGANSEADYYHLALSQNNEGDFQKAKLNVNKSIEKNGSNANYYILRGDANFGLEDYENAKTDYEKALSLDPNNNSIYKNLANVYMVLDNPEKALENINKGIDSATGDDKIAFLILQGNYYHNQGDLENAEKSFNLAFELNQESPVVLTNQAAVMIDQGDFEGAIEKCTQAIDLDGTQTEAYFNRGIANEMLRRTDEACSDWEEAFIMGAVKAEDYLNSPTCNE